MLRFQSEFVTGALAPGIDTAALSIPRGNGKTYLAAQLGIRALSPRSRLYAVKASPEIREAFSSKRLKINPTGI